MIPVSVEINATPIVAPIPCLVISLIEFDLDFFFFPFLFIEVYDFSAILFFFEHFTYLPTELQSCSLDFRLTF